MNKLIAENQRLVEKIKQMQVQIDRHDNVTSSYNEHIDVLLMKNKNLAARLAIAEKKLQKQHMLILNLQSK